MRGEALEAGLEPAGQLLGCGSHLLGCLRMSVRAG